MKRNNHPGKMIRILLLCLCTAMLAGTAGAEEMVDINEYAFSDVIYQDTLADGRVLLAGSGDPSGMPRPRLLCLNTNRTVSWEYLDETAGRYIGAAVLADGRIGAVLWEDGEEQDTGFILQFFTQTGLRAGEEIRIPVPVDAYYNNLTANRLLFEEQGDDGKYYLYDWDGHEIAVLREPGMMFTFRNMIEEEDGLVLFGVAGAGNKYLSYTPEIVKTDMQGGTIWKQVPDRIWPKTFELGFMYVIPAEDGGYLAIRSELQKEGKNGTAVYRSALEKLNRSGESLWRKTEGLEDETGACRGLVRFGGKIAAFFHTGDTEPDETVQDAPLLFRWFDESGKPLGTTTLNIGLEDFERLGQYTDADSIVDVRYDYHLVPMPDGLWATASLLVSGADGDAASDLLLVKVPEL